MLVVAFCAVLLVALRTPSHASSISCGPSSARRISGHCVCTLGTVCVGRHCSNGKRRRLRTPQTPNQIPDSTHVVHGYDPVKCPDCECKVPLRKRVAELGSHEKALKVMRRKVREKMKKDEQKLFWQDESRGKRLKVPNVTQNISACVMVKDDNDKIVEWVAYHHYTLPLTRVVICEEPGNQEYVRDRFANTEWENRIHFDFLVAGVDFYKNPNEQACLRSSFDRNFSNTAVHQEMQFYRPIQRACFQHCMKRLKSASGKCTLVHHPPIRLCAMLLVGRWLGFR